MWLGTTSPCRCLALWLGDRPCGRRAQKHRCAAGPGLHGSVRGGVCGQGSQLLLLLVVFLRLEGESHSRFCLEPPRVLGGKVIGQAGAARREGPSPGCVLAGDQRLQLLPEGFSAAPWEPPGVPAPSSHYRAPTNKELLVPDLPDHEHCTASWAVSDKLLVPG